MDIGIPSGIVQMLLAAVGGVTLKYMFERIMTVIARKDNQNAGNYSDLHTHFISQQNLTESFQRHVIEVLAKLSVSQDEIARNLKDLNDRK